MKLLSFLVFTFFISTSVFSQVQWSTFNKALDGAKSSNKKILMNVYADWNRWSKRMDKDVYALPDVQSYLNKYFLSSKLDAESNKEVTYNDQTLTEALLASDILGIDGYPTTVFFMPNGEVITSVPGYIPPDQFLLILKYIAEDHYKTMEWEEFLEKHKSE